MFDQLEHTPIPMTKAQYQALVRKFAQNPSGHATWRGFLQSAQQTFGCDSAITVRWCGMWLCIETDGYTHT